MLIYEHAIDKYISRVMNVDPSSVGENIRKFAKRKIKEAYENPEEIRSTKKNMPPFYIKDDTAIVVANEKKKIGERTIYKFDGNENNIIIPTVYNKNMIDDDEIEDDTHKQKGVT